MATERVLVLGAGHVVGPAVQYLTREPRTSVTVVSQFQEELDNIKQKFPGVHTVQMDLSLGYSELERHLDNHDIVISLLPCHFHPDIAKLCIQHKKSMLTASYVSPEMKELHHVAKEAGITILNEVGLDPGIDHMLAIQCIDEVQKAGGKITSFSSYCGGLPAPENNDTPLLYKFSWYPKGALMNLMSSAKYLKNGSIVEVPGNGGLLDAVENLTFMPGLNLEGFPNRDSTVYATEYGIESAHTIYRGTIRYKGSTEAVKGLINMGLFETKPDVYLDPQGAEITWKQYICTKFNKSGDILTDLLKDLILDRLGKDPKQLDVIVRLGLIDDLPVEKRGTPIDTLCNYLAKRLSYGAHERDMILMRHEIGIQWGDGKMEERSIDLVSYGDIGGFSAMAKTVGLPIGIAARMILTGEIQTKGVCCPTALEMCLSILQRLNNEGIAATEKSTLK